jgi:hypothetical protein
VPEEVLTIVANQHPNQCSQIGTVPELYRKPFGTAMVLIMPSPGRKSSRSKSCVLNSLKEKRSGGPTRT